MGLNLIVVVVREENVPNLFPLHFRRSTTRTLPTEEFRRSAGIDATLSIMVGNVAHQLFG